LPNITRFFLEGFVEIALTGSITLYFTSKEQFVYRWEALSTVLCYIVSTFVVIFPIWLIVSSQ